LAPRRGGRSAVGAVRDGGLEGKNTQHKRDGGARVPHLPEPPIDSVFKASTATQTPREEAHGVARQILQMSFTVLVN
ncbi:unnamed protein product, partial [Gadus morhua 'NCC']